MKIVIKTIIISLITILSYPELSAQGVKIYKKDGTRIVIPYNNIDSIVAYGYSQNQYIHEYINGYEAVDLGLSVKWAAYNVGASSAEEYGNYYAWGEIEKKDIYSEENYIHKDYVAGYVISYINIGINGRIYETQYDVAFMNWGENWRMPSMNEFDELRSKCIWEWTTLNNVNGFRVYGPNGNSIFLPATGSKYSNKINGKESKCYYWTGTGCNGEYEESAHAYFALEGSDKAECCLFKRYTGLPIRPVTSF